MRQFLRVAQFSHPPLLRRGTCRRQSLLGGSAGFPKLGRPRLLHLVPDPCALVAHRTPLLILSETSGLVEHAGALLGRRGQHVAHERPDFRLAQVANALQQLLSLLLDCVLKPHNVSHYPDRPESHPRNTERSKS